MNALNRDYSVAVVAGRWQLPHLGHDTLFRKALDIADRVVIVIGSAYRSRDPRQPFTARERQDMIRLSLSPADSDRVSFLWVRDYFNDARWARAVEAGVAKLTEGQTARVTQVCYRKDATSYYQDLFPSWSTVAVSREVDIDATALRKIYFEAAGRDGCLDVLKSYIKPGVFDYLQAWTNLPAYQLMATEHAAVEAYRKRWTAPFYLTADALVRVGNKVLLVQRGGPIGHGCWALPGGFLDPDEMFYPGALRELKEETHFPWPAGTLTRGLVSSETFEHPLRSPRGRLVTKTFYFAFEGDQQPEVEARDDAQAVKWWNIEELPSIEDQLFEDHSVQLDHFVGLFPKP